MRRRPRGGQSAPRRRDRLTLLSLVYLAGILFLAAVQEIVSDRHWLAVPLVYAPKAPLLGPPLLLGLVALAARSWRALAANASAAVACAYLLMHLVGPHALLQTKPAGVPLRVMTFNVHFGAASVPAVARAIRAAAPDLVCLQEVKAGPGVPDPAPALRRALAGWHLAHRGEYLIASRFPLRNPRELSLGAGHRSLLAVEVRTPGRRIAVYNVHFATALHGQALARRRGSLPQYLRHTAAVRRIQAATLARHLASEPGAVLLAGDFNTPPGSHSLRPLQRRHRDVFARGGSGFGFTFPNRLPLLRIDYLFASREFFIFDCRVLRTGASDHCAVVADLAVQR